MRRLALLSALLLGPGLGLAPPGHARAADTEKKPNVLIFLSDDVGYGEYGFQGATDIPTPNIDAIASSGVRFTQGYVSGPYCSPTRAGLMTGRYQTRFGHEFNSVAQRVGLTLDETTFADRFKTLGYNTIAIGKWHLGASPETRPTRRGFDEFYGTLANTPFIHPMNFVDSRISSDTRDIADPDFYTTDAYAARAVDWLERNHDKPWLLYLPFNAQHAPLQATPERLARFEHIEDQKRRTFSAMMAAMDEAVGAVMGKVRALGQEDNTLVIFFSDNGGPTPSTTSRNGPLHGFKATTWEGGVRVPFCMQWKGVIPAGTTYTNPIIQLDMLPTALAAAGATIDPSWKLDGVNLLPYLTGKNAGKPHEALYWRFGDQWAIRQGDWKLVVARGGSGRPELYNLADDIGESKDLASSRSEIVKELRSSYDRWNAEQAPSQVPNENGARKKAATAKKSAVAKKEARKAARNKVEAPPSD